MKGTIVDQDNLKVCRTILKTLWESFKNNIYLRDDYTLDSTTIARRENYSYYRISPAKRCLRLYFL
jgi:hypothetical protein